jgi:hypothetical protein
MSYYNVTFYTHDGFKRSETFASDFTNIDIFRNWFNDTFNLVSLAISKEIYD